MASQKPQDEKEEELLQLRWLGKLVKLNRHILHWLWKFYARMYMDDRVSNDKQV